MAEKKREPTDDEKSRLCRAIKNDDLDTIKRMMEPIDVNAWIVDPYMLDDKYTGLHYSVKQKKMDCVRLYLQLGADITIKDSQYRDKIDAMIKKYEKSHPDIKDGIHKFERIAYQLALSKGRAQALGIKLLLFGPEYVGKTCLVSTLVGGPYQEETATEGADVSILNTSNWKEISSEQVSDRLQEKFLRDLKESAKQHREVAMDKKMSKTTAYYADESLKVKSTAAKLSKALNFIAPWKKVSSTKSTIQAAKLDASEIKQAMKVPSIDLGDENGIDVTILDFAGQIMYHSTHSMFIRKENIIMVVFNASRPLSSNVKVRSSTLRSDPMTNSENVHFWMKIVHSICCIPGDENDKADLLPVILLVATHLDLLTGSAEKEKEDIIQQLAQELKGKPYALHLAGHRQGLVEALRKYCIFISNKCRNPAEIDRLRNAVFELSQPILSKEHPVVYLKIERRLLSNDQGVVTTEDFHSVATECGFSVSIGSKEFCGALEYFHNRGTVLHFPSIKSLQKLVFLSPHWLTKFISYILLAHPYQSKGGRKDRSFQLLIEKGILLLSFLSYMLDLFNSVGTSFEIVQEEAIGLLKKFGFVAQIKRSTRFLEDDGFEQNEEILIVPSLLPEDTSNTKSLPIQGDPNVMVVYYKFPDHFIAPMIYNNMVAGCISWNAERNKSLMWLRKGKVKMVLGNGQYYCINLAEEQYSIKLSIVLLPSHNHSADERKKLLHFFQGTLVSLVAEFMPATKKPIAYIPCFYCDHLHVEVELLLDGQQQDCPVVDKPIPPQHYQSLITDQEFKPPPKENEGNSAKITTAGSCGDVKKPTYPVLMEHLEKVAEWKLVAAHLLNDQDGSKTKEIEKTYHGDVADCRAEIIRLFLKGSDVSWQSVLTALRKAGYKNLADEIENYL